ncbi:MAG: hypothetical protein H0U95_15450 [Bacteroidetes bacterium]|nr:hypothetical protein [Bacteroidota bacterium]
MNTKSIFIGTAVSAGLVWIVSSLMSKKKVGDKLDTKTSVMLHSLDLKGLTLRIDVTLINPTEGTLTIKQPYIKVKFKNKDIGTTQLENKKIIIPAYAPKKLDPIYLTIPATGLFSLGDGLLSLLLKKQTVQITTIIATSIYIAGGFKSYEKTDVMNLNPLGKK